MIFQVNVNLKYPGKKLEHHGIKVEFVGQIGNLFLDHPIFFLMKNL